MKTTICTLYIYRFNDTKIRVMNYDGLFYFCADDILAPTGVKLTAARIKRMHLDVTWYHYPRPWKVSIDGETLIFLDEREILLTLVLNNSTAVDSAYFMQDCLFQLLHDFCWQKTHANGKDDLIEEVPIGCFKAAKQQYCFNDKLHQADGYNNRIMKGWTVECALSRGNVGS